VIHKQCNTHRDKPRPFNPNGSRAHWCSRCWG